MNNHHREPIKHTCPQIDKYIKWINMTIVKEKDLKNMGVDELLDVSIAMSEQLYDCINYLEELRTSNDILRCWGIEEAISFDKLEEKYYELESKIEK